MYDYQELAFAVFKIAQMTDTPCNQITEALVGIAWSEEEASVVETELERIYLDSNND